MSMGLKTFEETGIPYPGDTHLVCKIAAKRISFFLISVLNRKQGKGYGTILKAC